MRGLQPYQKVNVISHAASSLRNTAESRDRGAEVGMEFVNPFALDEWNSILRAEDEVEMEAEVG